MKFVASQVEMPTEHVLIDLMKDPRLILLLEFISGYKKNGLSQGSPVSRTHFEFILIEF